MADNHDLIDVQFINGDKQAAHDTAERMADHRTGIFDHLDIPVFDAQRVRQKLGQAGVHAGQYGQMLIGVFAGHILFIVFFLHKLLVVRQDIFNHADHSFGLYHTPICVKWQCTA